MHSCVRKALAEDLPCIPQIEKEAAALFSAYGYEAAVLADLTTLNELQNALEKGLLWVAEDQSHVVGFAFAETILSGLILSEVDVLPSSGRKGIGKALVENVMDHAQLYGCKCLFLTTYKNIPWNMPFYKKLGFKVLPENEYPADINMIVNREHNYGLDKSVRVVMIYCC